MKKLTMRRFARLLSKQFYYKSELCSNDINSGDNNPLPRQVVVTITDVDNSQGVPSILQPDLVSPSSTVTVEEVGRVATLPPHIENAPLVPEHYRKRHRFTKVENSGWRVCRALGCATKTPFQCLSCDKFYCNGEGKTPRWCFYLHICLCFKDDINDPVWHAKLKAWDTVRAKLK